MPDFIAHDVDHLEEQVSYSITDQSQDQQLLEGFFGYAELDLGRSLLAT